MLDFRLLGVTGVVVYAVSSYVLLRRPYLLHKKKRLAFRCLHISHRGGLFNQYNVECAGENIENTMTAFRYAVDVCRTDMLELDCQITGDGQVVVSHDNYLLRSCGVDSYISKMPYKTLPEYLKAVPLDFDKNFVHESSSPDRLIPLLADVFRAFPNMPMNIDIKRNDPELIEKVAGLIEEYKRESITVWSNFDDEVTSQCYARNANIPLNCSVRRVLLICLWYLTGLLPFIPLKESCLEPFIPSILTKKPDILNRQSIGRKLLLKVVDWCLTQQHLIEHLQKRGIHIYVWVLNDESEFERAFQLGIDGVMTDFPAKLRHYIDSVEK